MPKLLRARQNTNRDGPLLIQSAGSEASIFLCEEETKHWNSQSLRSRPSSACRS